MRIVFMGTPDFAVPSLKGLIDKGYHVVGVFTQPDKPKGRKRILTPPPVKVLAEEHNIPVFQPEKIRREDGVESVRSLQPDLIVTAAYGQILPRSILDMPKHGCINVHASLLPKNRGGAPIHWSIIRGEKETGVTIMYMVEALDAGDMVSRISIPIEDTDNVGTMFDKLAHAGAELLLETVPKLVKGEITPVPQNDEEATFSPNIKREDENIKWSQSNIEVFNQIRGLSPWPVAYTTFENESWKIWSARLGRQSIEKAEPGTIVSTTNEGIEVATGNGSVILTEIQPAGKKKMHAVDYLRGTNIEKGLRFSE